MLIHQDHPRTRLEGRAADLRILRRLVYFDSVEEQLFREIAAVGTSR